MAHSGTVLSAALNGFLEHHFNLRSEAQEPTRIRPARLSTTRNSNRPIVDDAGLDPWRGPHRVQRGMCFDGGTAVAATSGKRKASGHSKAIAVGSDPSNTAVIYKRRAQLVAAVDGS